MGATHLDKRARAQLVPAYIARTADARTLLEPSVGARVAALLHQRPPSGGAKLIALTFDDGPYPVATPLLLARLHDLGVPATFFLIGNDALQYPSLVRRIAADGHELGNHTFTHPNLDQLDNAAVARELAQGRATIDSLAPGSSADRVMRPPHGRYTLATVEEAQKDGYDVALWTDDPGDWRAVSEETLAEHVFAHATAPEVLLLHSGKYPTIALLDKIVPAFRRAGFTFVTLDRLIASAGPAAVNAPAHIRL